MLAPGFHVPQHASRATPTPGSFDDPSMSVPALPASSRPRSNGSACAPCVLAVSRAGSFPRLHGRRQSAPLVSYSSRSPPPRTTRHVVGSGATEWSRETKRCECRFVSHFVVGTLQPLTGPGGNEHGPLHPPAYLDLGSRAFHARARTHMGADPALLSSCNLQSRLGIKQHASLWPPGSARQASFLMVKNCGVVTCLEAPPVQQACTKYE